MLTETDIRRNLRAVDHAVAQQELEGLKVPESTVADLRRIARGEIQSEEAIRNIYSRFKYVPLFHPWPIPRSGFGCSEESFRHYGASYS